MFPPLSTARLGMKRFFESGANVDCCFTVPTVPPVTGSSYQRTRAVFGVPPLPTVCVSHSDSLPPWLVRFVYWFCIISRYVSVSSGLPGDFSGTVDGPTLNVPTEGFVGPVRVELA